MKTNILIEFTEIEKEELKNIAKHHELSLNECVRYLITKEADSFANAKGVAWSAHDDEFM